MVNFAELAMADTSATNTGERIVAFIAANFTTGPGATGWIMNFALAFVSAPRDLPSVGFLMCFL